MKELVKDLRDALVIASRPGVAGLTGLSSAASIVGAVAEKLDGVS